MSIEFRTSAPKTEQQPVTQPTSNIYQIAAKKLVQNAPLMIVTALALQTIASIPTATAGPCEDTQAICMRYCMTNGGPDPRETGACIIGCKLAYWVCKGTSMAMGWGW